MGNASGERFTVTTPVRDDGKTYYVQLGDEGMTPDEAFALARELSVAAEQVNRLNGAKPKKAGGLFTVPTTRDGN